MSLSWLGVIIIARIGSVNLF